jgi:hypothetical protein
VGKIEMKIEKIISLRKIKHDVFRDVVYEWEDWISEHHDLLMECPDKVMIANTKNPCNIFVKIIRKIEEIRKIHRLNFKRPIAMGFVTIVYDIVYFKRRNCIPVFLDIWPNEINYVCRAMRKEVPFFVTSLDVYKLIKKKAPNLNVYYIPLSVSDKWNTETQTDRTIDMIQMGRKNEVLHTYALKYVEKHPNVEYVYSGKSGTEGDLKYYSNRMGEIGTIETREKYMNLLRRSKICLLSSPGKDGSRERAAGIDFPTPRFYESAICKCFMLGRYTKNREFALQKIPSVCPYIDSYEDFEAEIDQILGGNLEVETERFQKYIHMHLTSTWFKEFQKMCEEN